MNNSNYDPLYLFQLDSNNHSNNREHESFIGDTQERMLDMNYNADFNFAFTNAESHIAITRTTVAAIELMMAENEEEEEEMLQREEEEDILIRMIVYESDLLDTIPYERIVTSMMEVALRTRVIYEDIFFEIFWGNPVFMKANAPRAHRPSRAYKTRHWWIVRHPNLSDNGQGREAFKSHYRITRAAFGRLVNILMEHPEYAGSQERDGISVEIQVVVVLWRFANSDYGFRIMHETLGILDGSYNNFTNRFINAMRTVGEAYITWPKDDLHHTREIMEGFTSRATREKPRLPSVVRAMDGKLVVIQKPNRHGDYYVDRKNHASICLLAVCDHQRRFIYIKVGNIGKTYDPRYFVVIILNTNLGYYIGETTAI